MGKTAKSILVSCGARLAPFDIKELREITAYCPYAVCQTAAAEVLVPGQAADRYLTGAPVLAAIEGILLFIPAYLGGKYRGK